MKHAILFYCNLLFMLALVNGQEGHFYIEIPEEEFVPTVLTAGDVLTVQTGDADLDEVYANYSITKYQQAFPTARTPMLQRIYEIECNSWELLEELLAGWPSMYVYGEELMEPQLLFTPNDYGGIPAGFAGQPALDLINAELAWNITTGDPDVVIGITDTYFETTHSDLSSQIVGVQGSNTPGSTHGTVTAGCAAAATNNSNGISGIGYNCKIYGSTNWGSDNEMLLLSQQGYRVLNASWLNSCSPSPVVQALYDEIWDNGTIVVAGAGNTPAHCGSLTAKIYPASYNHVISVSSVGHSPHVTDPIYGNHNWSDVHELNVGDATSGHHHNNAVDICAAGYNVLSTKIGNTYTGGWGTSFASPQVAGVCALILSVDPCLAPYDVELILKSTAANIYTLPENYPYIGLLGAGRVDAYAAVTMAQSYGTVPSPITGTTTWLVPRYLKGTLNINGGGHLIVDSDVKMGANTIINIYGIMELNEGSSVTFCDNCDEATVNVYGELIIEEGALLELSEKATINVAGGTLTIEGRGFCLQGLTDINVTGEGQVNLNGQNATSYFASSPRPTNISITSATWSAGFYGAINQILVTGNVTSSGNVMAMAGNNIHVEPDFRGTDGLHLWIDNCPEYEPCPSDRRKKPESDHKEARRVGIIPGVANIYPNPNNGTFLVESPYEGKAIITISDMLGKDVYYEEIGVSKENFEITLKDQKPGVYILRLQQNGEIFTSKVIKN